MEQVTTKGFEEQLTDIRRSVAEMRDKAVSAKTIQEQAKKQIESIVSTIVENIDDGEKKALAQAYGETFVADLGDEGNAELFFRFLEGYMEEREQFAMEEIARISEQIEEWKAVIEQEA